MTQIYKSSFEGFYKKLIRSILLEELNNGSFDKIFFEAVGLNKVKDGKKQNKSEKSIDRTVEIKNNKKIREKIENIIISRLNHIQIEGEYIKAEKIEELNMIRASLKYKKVLIYCVTNTYEFNEEDMQLINGYIKNAIKEFEEMIINYLIKENPEFFCCYLKNISNKDHSPCYILCDLNGEPHEKQ